MCQSGHCGIWVALLLPERVIVIATCRVLTLLVDVERSSMKKLVISFVALVGLFASPAALAEGDRLVASTQKTGKVIGFQEKPEHPKTMPGDNRGKVIGFVSNPQGVLCPKAAVGSNKAFSDSTGSTKTKTGWTSVGVAN